MGICETMDKRRSMEATERHVDLQWNSHELQASDFLIDGANLKLKDHSRKPHRICSKHYFSEYHNYRLKIRYVHFGESGSFAVGLFHFSGKTEEERIQQVGAKNVIRMSISRHEAEIQATGKVLFHSKEWRT
jgi:hypothetical protein